MLHGLELKKAVFHTICRRFDDWAQPFDFACRRGCASCCTRHVTITGVEAQIVLEHVVAGQMQQWLAARLETGLPESRAGLTTNQLAQLCLEGEDPPAEHRDSGGPCPFLEHDRCMIYPVRPFACRCFASTSSCRPGGCAVVEPAYLAAATAVSQIIEHLGQFDLWGNMLHVLYVIGCESEVIDPEPNENSLTDVRNRCTTAQPLPGFLFDESDRVRVVPLIESIFRATVAGKTVEDILNGR